MTPTPEDLTGLRLPGGTCRVEGYEDLLLRDAVRAPRATAPHPIWAFLAPQRGMGLTLAALFERLGCGLDAGPLLGRFAARWGGPFAIGADHEVCGGVTAVRRRRGRTLGVVDEVDVMLDLRRTDGARVVTATYGFLLPRPDVAPTEARERPETPETPETAPADPLSGPETPGDPITVGAEGMKLLALLLRDPNPIHLDADVAAAQGHRARVNQGPANLAYVLTFLAARHPDRRLAGVDARFRATVLDGDVVVPVVREGPDTTIVALRRADGRDAVTGRAELRAV